MDAKYQPPKPLGTYLAVIKHLMKLKNATFKDYILHVSNSVIKIIIEAAVNVLHGSVDLPPNRYKQAKKYKDFYNKLSLTNISLQQKRELLAANPTFAKSILHTLLDLHSPI